MKIWAGGLAVVLAWVLAGCGGGTPAAAGGGSGGGSGSGGGPTAGTGGATDGGTGGAATAGGNGGSAIAGTGGGVAGTGGATAGTGGDATAGAAGTTTAGTGGGATAGTGGTGPDPIRLLIFYTRWGTSYPEWFPTGDDRAFAMSAMMQALEPYKQDLIVVSLLTNANVYDTSDPPLQRAYANDMGDAMITLLTGRPAAIGGPARGPSIDTAIGDCNGAAGPPLRLSVGQFGYDDNPGVSFGADGAPIRGERDPHAAALRVLGHDVAAPAPGGDIDVDYPALGAAHMDVAVEALAGSKACVVTLMWGDQVVPKWIGLGDMIHPLSHYALENYDALMSLSSPSMPSNPFVILQRWYAQQFAALLARLRATPAGNGTLLDRSVVLWISESGFGDDHTGAFIPVVIAGRAGGRLDAGRYLQIKPRPVAWPDVFTITRTQGDLLAALASLWGIGSFGDPQITRQPLTEILLP